MAYPASESYDSNPHDVELRRRHTTLIRNEKIHYPCTLNIQTLYRPLRSLLLRVSNGYYPTFPHPTSMENERVQTDHSDPCTRRSGSLSVLSSELRHGSPGDYSSSHSLPSLLRSPELFPEKTSLCGYFRCSLLRFPGRFHSGNQPWNPRDSGPRSLARETHELHHQTDHTSFIRLQTHPHHVSELHS